MRLPVLPASVAASALLLGGCSPGEGGSSSAVDPVPKPPPAAEPAADAAAHAAESPAGIDWFAGGIDAAFATASSTGKPVLLYWGAEWCPYCADLEAHVLSRDDVRRKLELFVPVYLDGDDPGAQRAAEAFGVAGYPTVLALAPNRAELARIAGGMDLTQYAEMLDLVLGDLRPIDDILGASETGPLSPDDCRRLAYNGWPLADAASERAAYLAATLADAAERCADAGDIERARLIVYAASFAVAADGDQARPLARELVREMRAIVADRQLAVSIADALRELDERYFTAVQAHEP